MVICITIVVFKYLDSRNRARCSIYDDYSLHSHIPNKPTNSFIVNLDKDSDSEDELQDLHEFHEMILRPDHM